MPPLLTAGVELMAIGMGVVFLFLTLLVLATVLMSKLVQRFFPLPIPQVQEGGGVSAAEVAAITAAIDIHRKS